MKVYYFTNEGVKGFGNEDSILVDEILLNDISMRQIKAHKSRNNSHIFAISDGLHVGKYANIASLKVLEFLRQYFQTCFIFNPSKAFEYIKKNLENFAIKHFRYLDASATLVACYVNEDKIIVFNIGDSKAYLWRNKELKEISCEHTQARQMLQSGKISPKEYEETSDIYNQLTNYLVIGDNVHTFLHVENLKAKTNDMLLLCSDGVSDVLSKEEIKNIFSLNVSSYRKSILIKAEVLKNIQDNMSFILIDFLR